MTAVTTIAEKSASKSSRSWTYKFKPTSYTSRLGQYLDGDGYAI